MAAGQSPQQLSKTSAGSDYDASLLGRTALKRKKEKKKATTSTSYFKNILNAKEHKQNEESASTNKQNSQLASKWQYQIHT